MTEKEINNHVLIKKKYPDYPKLPKSLLKDPETPIDGHMESCLRGFQNRVVNWQKDFEIRMQNNI